MSLTSQGSHTSVPAVRRDARGEAPTAPISGGEVSAPSAQPDFRPRRGVRVRNLVKEYHTNIGVARVLDGISFDVHEGQKIAVLGRNGSGKSTLVKLLGGVEQPTHGEIDRDLFMSWPLGFAGGVENIMTGAASVRFIARLYNRPFAETLAFVDDFAELGKKLYLPIAVYSSGMRMKLAFALTLAVNFECFLIDEVFSVGDARFQRKCHDALFVQRAQCAMILVSHDIGILREYCSSALILKNGRGREFTDIDLALSIYGTL